MERRTRAALAAAALTGGLVLAPTAAWAQAVDPYSGGEVLPTTLQSQPPARVSPSTATSPSVLPFTGGELVLVTALGAGAVVGGAVLVGAARRRPSMARAR